MRKSYIPILFLVALFIVFVSSHSTPSYAENNGGARVLKSLNKCLPRSEVSKYGYSLAASTQDGQLQWHLVRAHSGPLVAPSYSVIQLGKGKCTNFNKLPVLDISRMQNIPKSVLKRFGPIILNDRKIAWSLYQKRIQAQYPGKSFEELKRMGVFGMDGL
jgi:hypothetical protein